MNTIMNLTSSGPSNGTSAGKAKAQETTAKKHTSNFIFDVTSRIDADI